MPDTVMSTDALPVSGHGSSGIAKLAEALAQAQKNFAPIPKDREVTVQSDRGSYKFKYATLDAIRSATMPALVEQKLAVVQGMIATDGGYAVETKLLHASGEWIQNITPMFVSGRVKDGRQFPPTNQELGSAQSYARRYGLSALLCITADEDDDGNTADGNHYQATERVPYKPRTGNMVEEARRDGTLDTTGRQKGTLPAKGTAKKLTAAEKAKDWTDKAITTLNLGDATKDSLNAFWKENADKIEWLETGAPDQHERFIVAWDNANDSAARKVA